MDTSEDEQVLDLLDGIPRPLLELTLDQVRSFVMLCHLKSVAKVAMRTKREHTTIRKQLEVVEQHLGQILGTPLFEKPERGGQVELSHVGQSFQRYAEPIALELVAAAREFTGPHPVRLGVTVFQMGLPHVRAILRRVETQSGPDVVVSRISSSQVQRQLKMRQLDFVFAGVPAARNCAPEHDSVIEFLEFERDHLGVLSNFPLKLPKEGLTSLLTSSSDNFIAPTADSIFYDMLISVLEPDQIKLVQNLRSYDLQLGMEMVCAHFTNRFMIFPKLLYDRAEHKRLRMKGTQVFFCPLELPYSIAVGAFFRKELLTYSQRTHPVALFRDALHTEHSKHQRAKLKKT